jgi:DNA-directed RNA polymerase beta' subunit
VLPAFVQILSPEEIKSLSVVNVQSTELYEEGTTRPKAGGLADPLMGRSVLATFIRCDVC